MNPTPPESQSPIGGKMMDGCKHEFLAKYVTPVDEYGRELMTIRVGICRKCLFQRELKHSEASVGLTRGSGFLDEISMY